MLRRLIVLAQALDDLAEVLVKKAWRRRGACLAVALAIGAGVWASAPVDTNDAVFLLDRAWIDNPRAGWNDRFSMWYFSDFQMKGRGLWSIHHKGVPSKAVYQIFAMTPENGRMTLYSFHEEKKFKVRYKITREQHEGCDLKLVIEGDAKRGTKEHTYWGRIDKRRRGVAEALLAGTMPR